MSGRILVGIDGSQGSSRALAWALEEAAARQAILEPVIVWQIPHDFARDLYHLVDAKRLAAGVRARLEQTIAEAVGDHAAVEIEPVVLEGDPAGVLCQRVVKTDLLVVGSRGHGTLSGLLLGSVSSKCAHHSRCPVAIIPSCPDDESRPVRRTGRILVGIDGSAGSLGALRWATEEAGARHATVTALMVWRGLDEEDDMAMELASFPSIGRQDRATAETAAKRLGRIVSEAGGSRVSVEPVLLEGDPAETLCQHAREADMLVVGSRGRGTFAGLLLGSVSSKCAHHSPVPVVIVPTGRDGDSAQPREPTGSSG